MDYQLIVHNFYKFRDVLSNIIIEYNFAFRMNLPGFKGRRVQNSTQLH